MKDMTLDAMAKACRGQLCGANTMQFLNARGIVIDSRMVQDDYVFVAIKGERTDGHRYIEQVFADGALAVVTEQPLTISKPYILVDSTRQALKDLAAFYLSRLDVKVVGISGSVGKTSTKEMIASVLSRKYQVHKTKGNFNNEIGLPLTIFKLEETHQAAVLEMGISDFGEMHRLAAVAQPDIAVLTNIGMSHLKTLGSRDGILKAKTGIAYKILDKLSDHSLNFEEKLLKDINSSSANVPETLAILRLAKAEAENFNKKTVGSEMILLGILAHQPSVAYSVLKKLDITLKDARREVENLVGYSVEENHNGFEYSIRAKKILDMAYVAAKKHGKTKIVSEHLLYAITKQPDCLAMKVLENLGTDVLEIKQGILKELDIETM